MKTTANSNLKFQSNVLPPQGPSNGVLRCNTTNNSHSHSSSSSSSSSTAVVDPTSVQSQFASLENDRSKLQNSIHLANSSYRKEQTTLSTLNQRHATLTESIRTLNDKLGQVTKKKQLLQNESARLRRNMQNDRTNLHQTQCQLQTMELEHVERCKHYVRDMDRYNDEMNAELVRYEEKQLMRRGISVQSVRVFLEHYYNNKSNNAGVAASAEGYDSNSAIASDGIGKPAFLGNDIINVLSERLDALTNVTDRLHRVAQNQRDLVYDVGNMRVRAKEGGKRGSQVLSDAQLNELEVLWSSDAQQQNKFSTNSMDDSTNIRNNEDRPQCVGRGGASSYQKPQRQHLEQQPINFGLFYGNSVIGTGAASADDHDMLNH